MQGLLIALIALALTTALVPGSWLFYSLTIQHGNSVELYYYNFTIVNVTSETVTFTLNVTYPNGTSETVTLSAPLERPFPLPINGSAFCLYNTEYMGTEGNTTIYHGLFKMGNVSVPVTAYYLNGVLSNYTGSMGDTRVTATLLAWYVPSAKPGPISDLGGWLIVAIVVGVIAISAIALIRIGKI